MVTTRSLLHAGLFAMRLMYFPMSEHMSKGGISIQRVLFAVHVDQNQGSTHIVWHSVEQYGVRHLRHRNLANSRDPRPGVEQTFSGGGVDDPAFWDKELHRVH